MSLLSGTGADPDAIERQISQTRERVDHTLEALRERLSPHEILHRTLDSARHAASETVDDVTGQVRRHPLPTALAVVSAALLVLVNVSGMRRRARVKRWREARRLVSPSRLVGTHGLVGSSGLVRGRDGAVVQLGTSLRKRPYLLAAAGLTLGVLVGASLPPPGPTERYWARRARDEFFGSGGGALRVLALALRAVQAMRS